MYFVGCYKHSHPSEVLCEGIGWDWVTVTSHSNNDVVMSAALFQLSSSYVCSYVYLAQGFVYSVFLKVLPFGALGTGP